VRPEGLCHVCKGGTDDSARDDMVSSWAESGITDGLAEGAEDAMTFSAGQLVEEGVVGQADELEVLIPAGPRAGGGRVGLFSDSVELASVGHSEVSQETISVGSGQILIPNGTCEGAEAQMRVTKASSERSKRRESKSLTTLSEPGNHCE